MTSSSQMHPEDPPSQLPAQQALREPGGSPRAAAPCLSKMTSPMPGARW